MKTEISIPDKLFRDPGAITEQINAICDEVDTRPDPFVAAAARRVLERTEW